MITFSLITIGCEYTAKYLKINVGIKSNMARIIKLQRYMFVYDIVNLNIHLTKMLLWFCILYNKFLIIKPNFLFQKLYSFYLFLKHAVLVNGFKNIYLYLHSILTNNLSKHHKHCEITMNQFFFFILLSKIIELNAHLQRN